MLLLLLSVVALGCGAAPSHTSTSSEPAPLRIAWQTWSAETFARAAREHKPILLSVQAEWCHFCHVMNEETFGDVRVRREVNEHFIAIRVEQSERPDLAERYRRYAWPATVFLSPEGDELLALRGYRPVAGFLPDLARVEQAARTGQALEAATPSGPPAELEATRLALVAQLDGLYDERLDGWGTGQRYPFAEPVEEAFFRAQVRGESVWNERATRSLDRYAQLIDPVFGGMYQYSVGDVWTRPHFEKIARVQAGALRAFSEAARVTGDDRWLQHAEDIRRYLTRFLERPDGGFGASQDADLMLAGGPRISGEEYYAKTEAERLALGVPHIDESVLAAENGQLIEALARYAEAGGDASALDQATRAADHLLSTLLRADGLLAHRASERDDTTEMAHLADQAWPLVGLLALHEVTGAERYLEAARQLADATQAKLGDAQSGGFFAHTRDPRAVGIFRERRVPIEDNAVFARGLLVLSRLDESGARRQRAEAALRGCARTDELRSLGRMVGQYLLTLEFFSSDYAILSVIGPDDAATDALFHAALRSADPRRLVELRRPGHGRYPYPGRPAVYICTSDSCSLPVTAPDDLPAAVTNFLAGP